METTNMSYMVKHLGG